MWHPANCGDIAGYGFILNTCTYKWNWTLDTTEAVIVQAVICGIYALSVRLLQQWVQSKGKEYKQPRWLDPVRTVHNISLSLVSLWMAVVMIHQLYIEGRFSSIEAMACTMTDNSGLYGFAQLIYMLSKLWEWVDTYFLILTQKEVIYLHYFHHMTTFTMAAVVHNFPVGGFVFINCLVHVIMYLHYAFPVRWARPYITSGQLIQFVMVLSIHNYGMFAPGCYDMKPVFREWAFCEFVVVGYFFFFANFFVQQYLNPKKKSSSKKEQ